MIPQIQIAVKFCVLTSRFDTNAVLWYKAKEEAKKVLQEANKLKQEANKQVEEANKQVEEADKKVEKANKQVKQMVCKMYEDGFSLEQISAYCSLNVDEIQVLIKS